MTHEQIALVALLAAQAFTIALLYITKKDCDAWRKAWLRDATELLQWKRYGLMRDPATGRYKRKGGI
jgi:hypothetical protein